MRSIIAALAVGLTGALLSGCVDEGSYAGPSRYPVERDYRRNESYDRYDRPRYQRYDPPRDESYDPYDRYPRYDQPDYRRSSYNPSFDRDDDDRWRRERDRDRERAERRREEDRRREEQRRNRQLDERNRELDQRNQELDERNREIARRQRDQSGTTNDNRADGPRPYQKPSLSVVCAPENGVKKCQLKGNNAFRGD